MNKCRRDLAVVLITFEVMYIIQQFKGIVFGLQELDLVEMRCIGTKPESIYSLSGYYNLEVGYRKSLKVFNLD